MRETSSKIKLLAFLVLQLSFLSCSLHHPAAFQVLPHAPAYLLRSPNLRQTSFPDVLRDYNGFEAGRGWIDLRPLMELRIENAYYEKGSSRRGLQGFLGTEVARYAVRPHGLRLLSVQPMKERPLTDTPVQRLISPSLTDARYYRLYFEIVFRSNNTHGSVLLGANSKEALEQLSAQIDHPETLCTQTSTHCTAFPEACSVSVEMKIVVNGRNEMLVWGSLLSSVVGDHPRQLAVKRLFDGRLTPIEINFQDARALQLPLLPGDQITWN